MGGHNPGSGNHRGSVFRLHVGSALIRRDGWQDAGQTWGKKTSAPPAVRAAERALERAVSDHLGRMQVTWVAVEDRHRRGALERGLIALLSNLDRPTIDAPSPTWLGHHAAHPRVRGSGLWNVDHVERAPQRDVLDLLAQTLRL